MDRIGARTEVVSVGAHLDGLGLRLGQVHNGANDNGTGSVAVLELARVLGSTPPRRSVLVALWGAEEGGLHGSRHFITHPTVAVERIVAHVNLDGVGRFDRSPADSTVIYAIGAEKACPDFVGVLRGAVARSPRFGVRTDDPNNWFRASDHYSFFTAGIPSLFLTDLGSEDYHRPTDDVERIDFARLAQVTEVAERVIRDLADRDRAICR
ncbi:MAG: M20/M25/M40 family metallo-hydrolase [Gemmatimonadales bacterium]